MKNALEALYACRNHWSWLWITGEIDKDNYKPSLKWCSQCACCHYINHTKDANCKNCPLKGYAWPVTCVAGRNSVYKDWFVSLTEDKRRKHALQMVRACDRAIEDILTGAKQ